VRVRSLLDVLVCARIAALLDVTMLVCMLLAGSDAYVTVRSDAKAAGLFSSGFGAPMLEFKTETAVQMRRRALIRTYPVIARCVCVSC
jgi:hypothetical protein